MKLGPFFIAAANAALYSHGKSNGDAVFNMDGNGISKVPLKETANIFQAPLDVLWISNNGAISFYSVDDNELESLKSNFVVAPLWGTASDGSVPTSGKVFYRTVGSSDFQAIADDINLNADVQSLSDNGTNAFRVTSAFQATYKNVINPLNTNEKNQYQVIVANGQFGNTSTQKTVVVFNYHMMEWVPDSDTKMGIFAAADEVEQCHAHLKDENDNLVAVGDLATGSNIGEPGKWIMVHNTDLECQDKFETECPVVDEGSRADTFGLMNTMGSSDPDKWTFYAHHVCIPGHQVSPVQNSVIATCEYDPDYYDARWNAPAPTCVDSQAVKTFGVKLVVDKIGDDDAKKVVGEGPERGQSSILVQNGITELIQYIGLTESQVSDISITPYDPEGFKDPEKPKNRAEEVNGPIQVEFELKLPLAVKDKVTEDDIGDNIKNILSELPVISDLQFDEEDVFVEDKTPSCLTECLGCQDPKNCGSKPPPIPFDACCGSCPEDNPARGKPYSSIIKACCTDGWNGEIYDPDTHVCCHGEVVDKAEYAVSFFTMSKCD
jgi:hypothetical protein